MRHGPTIGPVASLSRLTPPYRLQHATAKVLVALQCLIAVTGATVRVTGSGLGCPTWPRCTAASLVPVVDPAVSPLHVWIEFGNRMLSGVVGVVTAVAFVLALLARPRRRRPTTLSGLMLLGVLIEAVVGGITVLTGLNWWIVCIHFLISPALVWISIVHLRAVGEGDVRPRWLLPLALRSLLVLITAVFTVLVIAGTLVTAAGPHGGDAHSPRLGLPETALVQLHGDLLVVFLGMLVALGFALRAASATTTMWRRYWLLLAVTGAQGIVGFVQYLLNVPVALVIVHVVGAVVVTASAAALWCAGRDRGPRPIPGGNAGDREPAHQPG